MIRFNCPQCGATIKTKDEASGRSAACPQCRAPLRVPQAPPVELELEEVRDWSEDRAPGKKARRPHGGGWGVAALVCGIISVLACVPFGLAAIVCSVFDRDERGKNTRAGRAGFVLGLASTGFWLIVALAIYVAAAMGMLR